MKILRLGAFLALSTILSATASAQSAQKLLAQSGVKGGLVAHVGCGDGQLTAALRAGNSYLVHGLDADANDVTKARKHVRSLGLYGDVSIDQLTGDGLPYADGLVNLLIVDESANVSREERERVLAPGGVALIQQDGKWKKSVKTWPDDIDEWTHHLHDAGGNPVANDRQVGPPSRLRWTAGPLWARSHGYTPSVSAMVSAGGRLFYICDETLTGIDSAVPSKWALTARDAFSGVELWKVPVPDWGSANFSGTPDEPKKAVSVGRFTMPPQVGKRLVAVGDEVYVTLGSKAPITALNAVTGEILRVYDNTENADEILCVDGQLVVTINPGNELRGVDPGEDGVPAPAPGKRVRGINIKTGKLMWEKGPFTAVRTSRMQDPFGRLELCAGDGKVFFLTDSAIECLALESGKRRWKIERPALAEKAVKQLGFSGMYEHLLTVMVYRDGVTLLAQPEPNARHTYHTMPGSLYAFDAETGGQLWKRGYGGWGHCTPPDVFVVDDAVWTHVYADSEFGRVWGNGFKALDSSKVDYRIQQLDLRTGDVRQELSTKDIFDVGHHHRCYRNKITENYLMSSRRGVELVDLATGENYQNHWVRSGCLLGNLPCNGLLYVAPHPCDCYIDTKLTGFNALAAAGEVVKPNKRKRLQRGPAFGKVDTPSQNENDWATYRGDLQRSGATDTPVDAKLSEGWRAEIGKRLSGLTIADGKVFVADVDAHTVHALNAKNGKRVWQYTAGARVDSPPTIHEGLAIFGSTDGRVTCLRATDGAMVWRLNAAPQRRLITAFGQLESPWPVHGSVLIRDGKCWFAAGRSSYLDGGIRLFALDPATGRVEVEETIYTPDPETGKSVPETSEKTVAGLLNDILSSDGDSVFIRQMNVSNSGAKEGLRLRTTAGYLDSSWFNRTAWVAGHARSSGMMTLGEDIAIGTDVYGSNSRESVFTPAGGAYRLMCLPTKAPTGKKPTGKRPPRGKPLWQQTINIRTAAMVRAGDNVFIAGAPDVVDDADPHAAWEGRKGGMLAVFATKDGKRLNELKLAAPPVWDGMAASNGRLYVSQTDGVVVCLRP